MKFHFTALMAGLVMTNVVSAATEIDLHRQTAAYIENKLSSQTKDSIVKIEKVRVDVDFNGMSHTRIQQTYKDIPVWDATGVIHTPKAKMHSRKTTSINIDPNTTMNGVIYEALEKDLSNPPALAFTSPAAAQAALQAAKNLHVKKTRIAMSTKFEKEKSTPIIFIDVNKQAHRAYLTSFDYATAAAVHRPTSIVDAVTHQVYRNWEGILSSSPDETNAINAAREKLKKMLQDGDDPEPYDIVAGGVGGNAKIGEVIYDGLQGNKSALKMKATDIPVEILPGKPYIITFCVLTNDDIDVLDVSTGNMKVFNLCGPSKAHNGVAWLSNDKNQTRWNADEMNEGYSPSLDAFYAATMVKNMYQDWYNVPALIDKEGKPMRYMMRAHFGRKFDNAFWDGEQMTFGDGGGMFYPLTSAGVTAHEISHGFTDTHSHIDYGKPQMGALHESFSDMAAVALENYMTGKNGWDIGREIMKNEGALRYLDNPTKDGSSIDNMKDFDESEPHGAAGITNKAFYLIATTKGWDTHKAFNVMVKANMHYWTSSMNTLGDAACGVVSATKDYGYNIADVRVAFTKVGIDTDTCDAK